MNRVHSVLGELPLHRDNLTQDEYEALWNAARAALSLLQHLDRIWTQITPASDLEMAMRDLVRIEIDRLRDLPKPTHKGTKA